MNKREFLKTSSLLGLGSLVQFTALAKAIEEYSDTKDEDMPSEESFWRAVRADYVLPNDYIYLENGYYNIMPSKIALDYESNITDVNYLGAYYMRNNQADNKKRVTAKLADLAGCPEDELIITRNTTESLDMIISGLDWRRGDEAIMAEHDYGAMLNMFKQVSKRYGMVNKTLSVPLHPKSDEEIVSLYENAITPKTKLLMVCHMINITGHVLPIRKICDMAHKHGVLVMVDGAHTIAHLNFKIPELNCDFYGASLHKWLSAPLGCGMLYVKKENISKIWPLFAEDDKPEDDILRLNHTGTHPVATDLTIENAIDYYRVMGAERKEARLRYLQEYWTSKVRGITNVMVNTPLEPERNCAIANVGIKGMKPADMAKTLFDKYRIYTVAIDKPGVQGCRITPNVFNTTDELDKLVAAIKEMAA
ncbi:MAG: aminotransferase class V-fold PLP-dependent enzyme [Chitinophagales bacterium]|nr:aminotransferase class V-fold PLP-dependent enzyme [Chitinophagaceae bacterium]MCB9065963.1 aminotransferase class V-fold PLP-dependent enzyme [Chitinophagales bacterium]